MIKKIFQRLLEKSGKTYLLDPDIPDGLIWQTLYKRIFMLLRGIIVLKRKVYIGSNCSISNKKNIFFGNNVTIENNTIIDGYAKQKIHIGHGCRVGAYSLISCTSHLSKYGKGIVMGNNSSVGRFTEFGAAGGIEIGNDVIMGGYISFHSENHNFSETDKLIREQGVSSQGIKIGNDVWVGAKVTFLDGCVVGNHCVVAAGAVVKGVFPDHSIIGGVPARILKTIS